MTERPILFSAEMVRAILAGRKTQTWRKMKPQPSTVDDAGRWYRMESGGESLMNSAHPSPYGKPGDTLFVPETDPCITLSITDIRVERLQDISVADAKAEGCENPLIGAEAPAAGPGVFLADERTSFARLWNNIYGCDAWKANSWVWVIEFERVKP